jgi:hypothetical protein
MLIHLRRNAVAYLALFAALSGTSYAAVKLGRNAVKTPNIAPNAVTSAKVRNGSLLAADFKAGQLPAGARGDAGPAGPTGAPGATGAKGDTGAPGTSALSSLPAGSTESGTFAVGGPTPGPAGTESTLIANVSFPIPLAAGLDDSHIAYVTGGSATHCPGPGQAAAGYLCVYETAHSTANGFQIYDSAKTPPQFGTSRWGFLLVAADAAAKNPSVYAYGTWSVSP